MMTSNKYRQMERGGGDLYQYLISHLNLYQYLISQTTSFWKQVIPDRVAIIFRCERGRKCNQGIAHRDLEFG